MTKLLEIANCKKSRVADVVFVHGLNGDGISTWHPPSDRDLFWPEWLGQDLSQCGIWSLDYNANSLAWTGSGLPIISRATQCLDYIQLKEIGDRPVVFVCHSLGGLLTKQLLRHSIDIGWNDFAKNTCGIVFLATPHSGSALANWVDRLSYYVPLRANDIVSNLRRNDEGLLDLNQWYRDHAKKLDIATRVFKESSRTKGAVTVVDGASSDPGIPGVTPVSIDADHIEICKPISREEHVYLAVSHFVDDCFGQVVTQKRRVPEQGSTRVSIADLPTTSEFFVGREAELQTLDESWKDSRVNLLIIVALGGAGKSALVMEWMKRLQEDNWRDADSVFGYSFYSQGTRAENQVSAEPFLDAALSFFGHTRRNDERPSELALRLVEEFKSSRTLLILDGVEPLQYGPSHGDAGRFKDPSFRLFVRELAAQNSGLCVITSREPVKDVAAFRNATAPMIELEQLSDADGAALLASLGAIGTEKQLMAASSTVKGHGLALTLLGHFVRKAHRGRLSDLKEVDMATLDKQQGAHAWSLVRRYDLWLGDCCEIRILRMLGLFDRPATIAELRALVSGETIDGITDISSKIGDHGWNWAVSNLQDCGLVTGSGPTVDTHPIVRSYFAEQNESIRSESTQLGHLRLFEHLKATSKEQPQSIADLIPVYHAVHHGVKAREHVKAFELMRLRFMVKIGNRKPAFLFTQSAHRMHYHTLSSFTPLTRDFRDLLETTEYDPAEVAKREQDVLRLIQLLREEADDDDESEESGSKSE